MSERHLRVARLWIHPGQEAAFEAFEQEAARNMARHGGRIDVAVRLTQRAGHDDAYELHIVSFPDRASADAYAVDPETVRLRARREAIIARTDVVEGCEAGPY